MGAANYHVLAVHFDGSVAATVAAALVANRTGGTIHTTINGGWQAAPSVFLFDNQFTTLRAGELVGDGIIAEVVAVIRVGWLR